jgi:uncharacterized protein YjbI with pentapeptide repeats
VLQKRYIWIESNGASGERAELCGATFLMADLTDTNLNGANLADVVMAGSNISKATFTDANLNNANMGPTDLLDSAGKPTGREWPTNLTEADFTGADFTAANLRDALIAGADFTGAVLTDTRFGDANISGAIIEKPWPPISRQRNK